jgi:hypothetical protein
LGTFVFRKYIVENTFCGKIFAFRKKFLRGPWNGRGPKFWNTPPNQKPVGTALSAVLYPPYLQRTILFQTLGNIIKGF